MDNWNSRRSVVYARSGMVASSQPLATEIGLSILKAGGNCVDASVAVAAALNITEPTSTGIGGDCFMLYFNNKEVIGLNGSGRAPGALSIEFLKEKGIHELDPFSVHTITVPGAAAAWVDAIELYGTMELHEVLAGAINLAEAGHPVSPMTAYSWERGAKRQLLRWPNANEMLINGRAPKEGEIMKLPHLAKTFRELAEHGKSGFYSGRIATAITDIINEFGGTMTLEDLKRHESSFDEPITTNYRGVDVYEMPPNGQGITALLALNMLEQYSLSSYKYHSSSHLHLLIELLRIAFADAKHYVTDPEFSEIPLKGLLSTSYGLKRKKLFKADKASRNFENGSPQFSSDTVYFSVVDSEGQACSFINSNYMGFGTGLIPKSCGFTLQNRGHNFSLNSKHPNALEPGKRPYHTIIPAMALRDGSLFSSFGVMGGFMQPQGHLQVLSNMLDFKMNPQQALDAPRFCIDAEGSSGRIFIEDGIQVATMSELANLGHHVVPTSGMNRLTFGRGQIILRNTKTGVLSAGSDPRADGCAFGY